MTGSLILRLLVGGLLGGLIGLERSLRSKEAGVRTHFLVALGSALLMMVSQYAFSGRFDASRVAAQVVSGIGFIGAGTIIFQRNVVRGLTTAAGIWVAGAIGLACGAGMYVLALATTGLSLLVLELMHFVMPHFFQTGVSLSAPEEADLYRVLDRLKAEKVTVISYSFRREERRCLISLTLRLRDEKQLRRTTETLSSIPGIALEQIG